MVAWRVHVSCSQSNIVLIITDDQDLTLGGLVSEFVGERKKQLYRYIYSRNKCI